MKHFKKIAIFLLSLGSVFIYINHFNKNDDDNNKEKIVIAILKSVNSIHPHNADGEGALNVVSHMYQGLTMVKKNCDVTNGIADEIIFSKEKKEYTFKLKHSLWSNGDQLYAHHFVDSFKKALNPLSPAPLSPYMDCISGARNFRTGQGSWDEVGIYAEDDHTIKIQLDCPCPYFLYLLSTPLFYPVHEDKNVSNGPFTLHEWKINDKITLKKNNYYWDVENIKIDVIEFDLIQDPILTISLLQQNKAHYASIPPSVSTFCKPSKNTNKNIHFCSLCQTGKVSMLMLNKEVGVLKNKKVRAALSLSIDRPAIVNNVTKRGLPAYHVTPPLFCPSRPIVTDNRNLHLARALLVEGLKELNMTINDFKDIKIDFCPFSIPPNVIEAIQDQIRQTLGVYIKAVPFEMKVQLDHFLAKKYSISSCCWYADYPDPISFLEIFESNGIFGMNWSSDKFDKIINNAKHCENISERQKLLSEAEKYLLNDFAVIPIYYPGEIFGVHRKLKGFQLSPLHIVDMSRAYWDK